MPKVKPYTEGTLRVYRLKLQHILQFKELYTQQLINVNNFLDQKENREHYPVCIVEEFKAYKQDLHDKLAELEININNLEVFTDCLRVIDNNAD